MSQKIVLWKLGDVKRGLSPTDKTIQRLAEVITEARLSEDDTTDIIWGDIGLNVEVIEGDIDVIIVENEDGTQSIKLVDQPISEDHDNG